ncbi:MAG: iron-containing alcohol dehydrogenase [Firmicutes bacterium]|nr:iron-containing alcohol dehydrogenase [Bacillota bacterium]
MGDLQEIEISSFITPREKIVFGQGALQVLGELSGDKAVVVTDHNMELLGLVDKVVGILKKGGYSVSIYKGVEPDPSLETVARLKDFVLNISPDLIVALGGGSVIDAAKAGRTWSAYPELDFDTLRAQPALPRLKNTSRLVAIPSTSGTGSEVTPYAVVTDRRKIPHRKIGMGYPEQIPDVAILDPTIPATMPPKITANTGFDAFSHALEAYTTKLATDYTDAVALYAIYLLFRYLLRAYRDGADLEARAKVHNASCLAGIALANAGAGIMHSLGHILSAQYGVPHGATLSIFMPVCMEFNIPALSHRYADVARILGIEGVTEQESVQKLIDKVRELQVALNLPQSIVAAGVPREHFLKFLETYVEHAYEDGGTHMNGREATKADLKDLFIRALG